MTSTSTCVRSSEKAHSFTIACPSNSRGVDTLYCASRASLPRHVQRRVSSNFQPSPKHLRNFMK
ncbi:hypothetical protein BDQ12DRAFT_682933 [Crucibulum laeve]|uniref:Uncharacterized protein n=1 Tax=Crucibulum laeve TaxID=68775 RepID=A0A5C3M2K8_9AGAR|nr:hypothetical protein BDQ12DRAFT_682933 [Crucibulum laeve]